jgi:cell division protein FtsQ
MDGGRRVLRSLREPFSALFTFAHARPLAAGASFSPSASQASSFALQVRDDARTLRKFRKPAGRAERLAAFGRLPGLGLFLTLTMFATVGFVGSVQNGGYAEFVANNGAPRDVVARALGFEIEAVTITGLSELRESEILAASGVDPTNSLPFLDADAVRKRLMDIPLVESARVLKLYPNRLVIALEERKPFALWQRDGHLSVVAADGKVVDELRDERFLGLPFVVGEGAEKRLAEYARLLAAAGDLKSRIKAGTLVSGRRWTFTMTNGVAVKLPEQDPEGALAALQRLQREARILDKDILSVDLRTPGRVAVRLTEEGVAARAATLARKTHKAGQT